VTFGINSYTYVPKPHHTRRDVEKTTTPMTIFWDTDTSFRIAFPCFYRELVDKTNHMHCRWHNHPHHSHRCRQHKDFYEHLLPIDLVKEGYTHGFFTVKKAPYDMSDKDKSAIVQIPVEISEHIVYVDLKDTDSYNPTNIENEHNYIDPEITYFWDVKIVSDGASYSRKKVDTVSKGKLFFDPSTTNRIAGGENE
jgi:hypothetical protein